LTMEPVQAIAVLSTIYVSATFAGSITAILINTPGTSAAGSHYLRWIPVSSKRGSWKSSWYCRCIKYYWGRVLCYSFMYSRSPPSQGSL
jgi:hypothetical protein